jgi:hypothetical protein
MSGVGLTILINIIIELSVLFIKFCHDTIHRQTNTCTSMPDGTALFRVFVFPKCPSDNL